jgi:hypothetical protein
MSATAASSSARVVSFIAPNQVPALAQQSAENRQFRRFPSWAIVSKTATAPRWLAASVKPARASAPSRGRRSAPIRARQTASASKAERVRANKQAGGAFRLLAATTAIVETSRVFVCQRCKSVVGWRPPPWPALAARSARRTPTVTLATCASRAPASSAEIAAAGPFWCKVGNGARQRRLAGTGLMSPSRMDRCRSRRLCDR